MSAINPLSGALLQSGDVQKRQSLDKAEQLKRKRLVARRPDEGANEDEIVENAGTIDATDRRRERDQPSRDGGDRQETGHDRGAGQPGSGLDLTA